MIHLLNETRTSIGSFANYNDLVHHINKTELSRTKFLNALKHTLAVSHVLDQSFWNFIYYKYDFLKTIYSCMKEPPLTEIEREAFRQGLDLIEINQGSEDNPLQIPVNQDTNIESLKKDFCLAYCKAHNYVLSENFETSESSQHLDLVDMEEQEETIGGEDDPAL